MPESGREDAGVWRCPCGRQVPARFGECHCGVTRAQAVAAAQAGEPAPPKPLTLLALSLRLAAAAAVIVMGAAVYLAYRPEAPSPVAASPAPTTLPRASAAPAPTPLAGEPATGWSNDPTLWVDPGSRHQPPPNTTPTAAAEADLVQATIEQWRARYRAAAERVARLQRDVILLESGAVPYDSKDPGRNEAIRRMNELLRERLAAARRELEEARKALDDIEAGAEAEGVPASQLR